MSLRTPLTRLAIAAATGALVAVTAASPALADGDWNNDPGNGRHEDDPNGRNDGNGRNQGGDQGRDPRTSRGQITARGGLLLRAAPNRGSQVIRLAPFGEIVRIFCKTRGQNVAGTNVWYLLEDGTWAWGSARYIETLGRAPRQC